ncbi:MAG TPA: ABC transporter permease [Candidatus Acidoferrum sp.]|jgi:predicted permease
MYSLLQDLRFSVRQLVKSPGFTFTALISLALGIGATAAVFSVIYAALLNPFPYPNADRIVRLRIFSKETGPRGFNPNGPQIRELQKLSIVDSLLVMDYQAMTLTGREFPENVQVIKLIGNGFSDLKMSLFLGRGILPSDAIDGQDPQPVAVLSYEFWRKHFLGDPGVIGRMIELDHQNYQVVGVVAPHFTWYSPNVYLPLKLTQNPGLSFLVDLRLKPGVTYESADAALQPILEQFAREMPKRFPQHFRSQVEGLNAWVLRHYGGTLYLMFGAVMLLLAIGCGNVSILLLARGTARQHELAVRAAVGAERARLLRQLLTESLLLSVFGAALGILTAYGILAGLRLLLPPYAFAPEVVIRINLPVLYFSVGVALATGILFGLWPALQLSRTQVGRIMQSSTRRVAGSVSGHRMHSLLIGGQIALTLLLLTAAGSALKSFTQMLHRPLGYDPRNVMSVEIPVRINSYTNWHARSAYLEQLRRKVAEMPGVTVAAISSYANPPRSGWDMPFEILGRNRDEQQISNVHLVSSEYFSALHIPLLQGRMWTETENHDAAHVALINRALASLYFPNGDAIGHSIKLSAIENAPPEALSAPDAVDAWVPIVGIVDDFLDDGMRNAIRPAIFVPYTVELWDGTQILVRTNVPPLTLANEVRKQLAAVNPDQQVGGDIEELGAFISNGPDWQQEHLAAWIFAIFAWLGLVLAAVGLYSVVSYAVGQRTNEFGIRMALGAQRRDLLRIVFGSAATSVGGGVLAGVVLSLALGSIFAKWAEGNVRDPVILIAGTVLLGLVAAAACAIPARHAAAIDPMTALRCD